MNGDNICNYRQYTYACSTTTVTSTANVECGSNVYCTNNQCTKVEDDSSQDFATSIAYLSSINQAAKDNNASSDNLRIFSGAGKSCEKDAVSYNNCCKDDGWGQDYTGAACKEEEKSLMEMQSKKLCHYVGSYCSEKVPLLGKCLKTKKSYCCFNSKISRVITEQGRSQLGKGWGSAESPDCGGFTTDELSHLQFDKMDLGEIAADIAGSVVVPDKSYLEGKVKTTLEGYGQKSN
jgi:conjugal transfer mating pair stabilization protein TraN